MLDRYPNLYVDLGGMGYSGAGVEHYGVYWPKRTPWMHLIVDEYGTLTPDMKTLFERFSDRFTLGTDIAHARVYWNYRGHVPRWRRILTQLSPQAARNIAFATAERMLRMSAAGQQRFAPLAPVPV